MRAWRHISRCIAIGCVRHDRWPWLQPLRWAHNDGAQTSPTLKSELRRLYKLIHPDLLQNLPTHQATNQRSFQLLQEYLNAAKEGGSSHRFVYNFEFYIRRAVTDDGPLEKVEVSLPAPQVKYHPHRGTEILPATRNAIGRLFAACGLSAELSGGLAGSDWLSLSDFFQQASELQRQNEASVLNLEQQIIMVRNAMRMRSGITVSFRPPLADAPIALHMEALEKLAKVVDRIGGNLLAGFSVMLGDSYGVDALGNIWLVHSDGAEAWTQFLCQADLPAALECKLAAKERHLKELQVAAVMEVEMVFTHATLAIRPAYSLFLTQMAEGAAKHGPVGAGKFIELPVRLTGSTQDSGDQQRDGSQSSRCFVDETVGAVVIPVSEEFWGVYRFIEQHGDKALTHRRRHKSLEKKIEDLKIHVRKKLRLRHLTLDPKISSDQQMSAFMRLSRNAPELLKYTEGLSLCISDEFRLPQGTKGQAYVKWNFSMADL